VVVVAREDSPGDKRLVAYVVGGTDAAVEAGLLRSHVRGLLPDYMVPSAFVLLDQLPLTPNGKLDRKALPKAEYRGEGLPVSARSPQEAVLAEIVAGVLGVAEVGVHDSFFELGGDSILLLQVISRARRAGLHLTARQMFEHQSVAALAAVATTTSTVLAPQGPITGPVPLTPIQHWYFAQHPLRPGHFNQSVLLHVPADMDVSALGRALAHLTVHHDALRLRFERVEGQWRQRHAAVGEGAQASLACVDLPGDAAAACEVIAAESGRVQAGLDLEAGPLLRGVLFQGSGGAGGRLFLAIHHLVVDGVSWRILLEDLASGYGQARSGSAVSLPRKTSSFRDWSLRLRQHAGSPALASEEMWWSSLRSVDGELPLDLPWEDASNTSGSVETVSIELDAAQTRALLQDVPPVYHTQINDVLLTALCLALTAWTGRSRVLVDLEGHGREAVFEELDVSRTVGWFTSLFPVALELMERDAGLALKAVKEQLRAIPGRGLGYGLLRYLREREAVADAPASPVAQLCFNYLGQLDAAPAEQAALLAPAAETTGPNHDPGLMRAHRIVVNGAVQGGRLIMSFEYSRQLHRHATIARLADSYRQALHDIITHCLAPGAGGFTPSDFPETNLNQHELDAVRTLVRRTQ
jgi:non-ribosomal peptide synthase protein (TIGR01720 family)